MWSNRTREKSVSRGSKENTVNESKALVPYDSRRRERRLSTSVSHEDFRATFENLLSVISSGGEDSFSVESVRSMLESVYEWVARRKGSSHTTENSPLSLKEIGEDYASTVASSVVSSTLEKDMNMGEVGTVYSTPVQFHAQSHPALHRPQAVRAQELERKHTGHTAQQPYHSSLQGIPERYVPDPRAERIVPRYSMAAKAVEVPTRVQESP